MLLLKHKQLDVWKLSIDFVAMVYETTKCLPDHERFGLIPQMRRASVSVASNIAEGASRRSANDYRRFLEIARSSLVEIDTQLEIIARLGYLTEEESNAITPTLTRLFAMLSKLKTSVK